MKKNKYKGVSGHWKCDWCGAEYQDKEVAAFCYKQHEQLEIDQSQLVNQITTLLNK